MGERHGSGKALSKCRSQGRPPERAISQTLNPKPQTLNPESGRFNQGAPGVESLASTGTHQGHTVETAEGQLHDLSDIPVKSDPLRELVADAKQMERKSYASSRPPSPKCLEVAVFSFLGYTLLADHRIFRPSILDFGDTIGSLLHSEGRRQERQLPWPSIAEPSRRELFWNRYPGARGFWLQRDANNHRNGVNSRNLELLQNPK